MKWSRTHVYVQRKQIVFGVTYPFIKAKTNHCLIVSRDNATSVDESFRNFPLIGPPGDRSPSTTQKDPTVNRLALFHFQIKSLEDFQKKMTTGGGDGSCKDEQYFRLIDRFVAYSDAVWKLNDCFIIILWSWQYQLFLYKFVLFGATYQMARAKMNGIFRLINRFVAYSDAVWKLNELFIIILWS